MNTFDTVTPPALDFLSVDAAPVTYDYTSDGVEVRAGEKVGATGERLVAELVRDVGYSYLTDRFRCSIPFPEDLKPICNFRTLIADGFTQEWRTYWEVKSGTGLETDSLDRKFVCDLQLFVVLGIGDMPIPSSTVLDWHPVHRVMVFVWKKQHSQYVPLMQEWIRRCHSGEQPLTPEQFERAHRYHVVNSTDLTPAWMERYSTYVHSYDMAHPSVFS